MAGAASSVVSTTGYLAEAQAFDATPEPIPGASTNKMEPIRTTFAMFLCVTGFYRILSVIPLATPPLGPPSPATAQVVWFRLPTGPLT